jgi:endopolyphosphatase
VPLSKCLISCLSRPDFHPDHFYSSYSSSEEGYACHRGDGPAGVYGAETTDCDSPISLINATFDLIKQNIKDKVDFVIWTGDSARHDSDESLPRTEKEVVSLNEMLVSKFTEVFGKDDKINDTDPTNDFTIPVVPNFGNNDIMPHNIFEPGPNKWTKKYSSVWKKLIPEEQRHGFIRGGWFSVEVIPNRLTVFSLNTLYFFDSNTAVDGCASKSEPGYEQMEWLRIQLQFIRQRGMKAMLMGHVPPARTESKQSWDETCWQKYTLWMRQYRDVIVGSVYGHMNIDHFMLQDFGDISKNTLKGKALSAELERMSLGDELTIESSAEYLTELRAGWSQIPDPPKAKDRSRSGLGYWYEFIGSLTRKKPRKTKEDKLLEKIGGKFGERYALTLVSPSVVPNYFPTMRVVEYNITGLENMPSTAALGSNKADVENAQDESSADSEEKIEEDVDIEKTKHKKKKGKKNKKHKKPSFTVPKPPSKRTPPGPAYSPQTLSWLGYTQYYANLTRINNDFISDDAAENEGWHGGKHRGKKPKEKSRKHHKKFEFEVEYTTYNDTVFGLKDLSVRSYLDLAGRIGQYKPEKDADWLDENITWTNEITVNEHVEKSAVDRVMSCDHTPVYEGEDMIELEKNKKYKKHHRKHEHRKAINKVWFTFLNRAYVGTRDDEELHDEFGRP